MCLNSLNACKVTIFQTIIQAFSLIFFTDRAKRKKKPPPSLPQPLRREGRTYAHTRDNDSVALSQIISAEYLQVCLLPFRGGWVGLLPSLRRGRGRLLQTARHTQRCSNGSEHRDNHIKNCFPLFVFHTFWFFEFINFLTLNFRGIPLFTPLSTRRGVGGEAGWDFSPYHPTTGPSGCSPPSECVFFFSTFLSPFLLSLMDLSYLSYSRRWTDCFKRAAINEPDALARKWGL